MGQDFLDIQYYFSKLKSLYNPIQPVGSLANHRLMVGWYLTCGCRHSYAHCMNHGPGHAKFLSPCMPHCLESPGAEILSWNKLAGCRDIYERFTFKFSNQLFIIVHQGYFSFSLYKNTRIMFILISAKGPSFKDFYRVN